MQFYADIYDTAKTEGDTQIDQVAAGLELLSIELDSTIHQMSGGQSHWYQFMLTFFFEVSINCDTLCLDGGSYYEL